MEREMLIISKEQVRALSERLSNPGEFESCKAEVRKMVEIKSALLWRADVGSCCIGRGLAGCLEGEVQLLENILSALEEGDVAKGVSLLRDYEEIID